MTNLRPILEDVCIEGESSEVTMEVQSPTYLRQKPTKYSLLSPNSRDFLLTFHSEFGPSFSNSEHSALSSWSFEGSSSFEEGASSTFTSFSAGGADDSSSCSGYMFQSIKRQINDMNHMLEQEMEPILMTKTSEEYEDDLREELSALNHSENELREEMEFIDQVLLPSYVGTRSKESECRGSTTASNYLQIRRDMEQADIRLKYELSDEAPTATFKDDYDKPSCLLPTDHRHPSAVFDRSIFRRIENDEADSSSHDTSSSLISEAMKRALGSQANSTSSVTKQVDNLKLPSVQNPLLVAVALDSTSIQSPDSQHSRGKIAEAWNYYSEEEEEEEDDNDDENDCQPAEYEIRKSPTISVPSPSIDIDQDPITTLPFCQLSHDDNTPPLSPACHQRGAMAFDQNEIDEDEDEIIRSRTLPTTPKPLFPLPLDPRRDAPQDHTIFLPVMLRSPGANAIGYENRGHDEIKEDEDDEILRSRTPPTPKQISSTPTTALDTLPIVPTKTPSLISQDFNTPSTSALQHADEEKEIEVLESQVDTFFNVSPLNTLNSQSMDEVSSKDRSEPETDIDIQASVNEILNESSDEGSIDPTTGGETTEDNTLGKLLAESSSSMSYPMPTAEVAHKFQKSQCATPQDGDCIAIRVSSVSNNAPTLPPREEFPSFDVELVLHDQQACSRSTSPMNLLENQDEGKSVPLNEPLFENDGKEECPSKTQFEFIPGTAPSPAQSSRHPFDSSELAATLWAQQLNFSIRRMQSDDEIFHKRYSESKSSNTPILRRVLSADQILSPGIISTPKFNFHQEVNSDCDHCPIEAPVASKACEARTIAPPSQQEEVCSEEEVGSTKDLLSCTDRLLESLACWGVRGTVLSSSSAEEPKSPSHHHEKPLESPSRPMQNDDDQTPPILMVKEETETEAQETQELLSSNERLLQSMVDFDYAAYCALTSPDLTGVEVGTSGGCQVGTRKEHFYNQTGHSQVSMINPVVRFVSPTNDVAVVTYSRIDQVVGGRIARQWDETRIWERRRHYQFHRRGNTDADRSFTTSWINCHYHQSIHS